MLAFGFLIAPLLVILPLSFNAEPYFTFTEGALCSTLLAAVLGTLAVLGLSRAEMPFRNLIMGLLISPMIVPLIITAAGIFFFYASLNEFAQLTGSFIGIVLAHTVLGTPFVVITVTATLIGFDRSLVRAGLMCGATPTRAFFKVVLPLILPGVISGALFAFATSFDEIVVVLFVGSVEYQTIPRQMRAGIREEISPIILAVATLLIGLSTLLMIAVEMLRRYNERQRGVSPG
ncbi:MAG: ABC transporter permease [Kiloniellales bacterium]|nr:ABC transporter permease [Kiloniellales bacterium]